MKLLKDITALVDKGVATDYRVTVAIGMVIPIAPLIFVDGAPIERFPVLTGLALLCGLFWGVFVTWRYLRHMHRRLDSLPNTPKSRHLWPIILGALLFFGVVGVGELWLSAKIGWPEAYGLDCNGRRCFLQELSHSPQLLEGGSLYELELFALLWLLPGLFVALMVYAMVRRGTRRTPSD